jgi:hypothetical protein
MCGSHRAFAPRQETSTSFAPYAQMGDAIGGGIDATAVRGWLDAAMTRETSVADTHPALADRLRGPAWGVRQHQPRAWLGTPFRRVVD